MKQCVRPVKGAWVVGVGLAVMASSVASVAWAGEVPESVTRLKEVKVEAAAPGSDPAQNADAGTSTVTAAKQLELEGAKNLKDAFREELDVSVRTAPTRFTTARDATGRAGSEGVNIRGLEGNQVLMLVDGIRLPNSFSFGSFSTGRGDFVDVDGLKAAEVVRGPSSTQLGSDGLAGVVSFKTLNPSDLLKNGQKYASFVRSGYASVDQSWGNTVGFASQNGAWQTLLLASLREGHETSNKGDNNAPNISRTTPNPANYRNQYVLAKAFLQLNSAQQLGLTLESQNRWQDTWVYSARPTGLPTPTATKELTAHDWVMRNRVSLTHRYDDVNEPLIQKAVSTVYVQNATTQQLADEVLGSGNTRVRNNAYQSDSLGFSTTMESNFVAPIGQTVRYGVNWSQTKTSALLDGTSPPPGQTFPNKPFPDTQYTLAGAFVQSDMMLGNVILTPALRFDGYDLQPSSAGYAATSPVVGLSGQAVSPKLGAVWQISPQFAPYAQIAAGFNPPSPDQVNNGFSNLTHGYVTIGNPNLKPEYAKNAEIGFKGKIEAVSYALAIYDNHYQDFISQQIVKGAGTPTNPLVFQYVNLASVHIRGVELRSNWQVNDRWNLNAGWAYSQGTSTVSAQTGEVTQPLDTIEPMKVMLGLNYNHGDWGARAHFTYSEGKDKSQIAAPNNPFAPPSYSTLDVGAYWKPATNFTLNANLNNVFDAKYWRWSDSRGLAANSPVLDAYTASGRNLQVSVRYDF